MKNFTEVHANWDEYSWTEKKEACEKALMDPIFSEQEYDEIVEWIMEEEAEREVLIENGKCPDCEQVAKEDHVCLEYSFTPFL
jgi:hypothetical protein